MTTYYPCDDSFMLHTDLYQINMAMTYWAEGIQDKEAVFEGYFRSNPFESGYAIFVGLEKMIRYLSNLKFTESDLDYLRSTELFPEEYIQYLGELEFKLSVRSFVEGELCFANEPLIQVQGPLLQCQLVETALLNIINYQTLIATKAARIRYVSGPKAGIAEFGSRRAHEFDAAIWGTRAAYIGGFNSTSNVRAGKLFGMPISGTHAHSLVQAYRDEYEAFKAYAETHKNVVFLVDTYDTLRSGVPNAIRVANEMGDRINFIGVRIDSGDITYQSKHIREMLDEAGYPDAHIIASNDLDELTILNLNMQGAKVDDWGIGTKLITAYDQPALGAVYKLVSIADETGQLVPTMKISSNAEKITTPGVKQVWRIISKETGKGEGDYITFEDADPNEQDSLFMFHPTYTYINKTVENFEAKPMLHQVFDNGKLVYDQPDLDTIRSYAQANLEWLDDEHKRVLNPTPYPVDLSQELYDEKMNSIRKIQAEVNQRVQAMQQAKE